MSNKKPAIIMDRIVLRFKGMRLFLFWLLSMFLSLALAFVFVFIAHVRVTCIDTQLQMMIPQKMKTLLLT